MFGDWNLLRTLLYVIGIVLLLVEGVMPGFGVAGVSGFVCVVISIVMITSNLYQAMLLMIATITIFIILLVLIYKFGFADKYMDAFVLKTEQKNEDGYKSATIAKDLVGKVGITLTTLRPAGTIEIDNMRFDAITDGEFIEGNTDICVVKIDSSSVVVRKIK